MQKILNKINCKIKFIKHMKSQLQIKFVLAFTALTLIFCASKVSAQVGIGTTTPDNSAILELKSTNKGFLVPRMSSAERTAIVLPAKGLMVFDNDSTAFYYYDGSMWKSMKSAVSYTSGTGISVSGLGVINAQTSTALWNASKLQGNLVSTAVPSTNQVLKWNGTIWAPASDSVTSYSAGTALSLSGTTFSAQNTTALWNANKLQGKSVSTTAPTSGQTLKWNGVSWTPANDSTTAYAGGTGVSISGTTINANTTSALWNANQLQGKTVSTTTPSSGQTLKWNGVSWTPANDSTTAYSASTGLTLTGTAFSAQTGTALWNANKLQGTKVGAVTPTNNQVLKYNSTSGQWAPANDTGAYYSAGTGMSLSGTTFNANTTTALWNASQLQGRTLSSTAPTSGQTLKWNGTSWTPGNDSVATYTAGNGVSMSSNKVTLGGALTGATTIGTSSSNTLKLTGVQAGANTDSVVVISGGVIKKVAQSSIAGTTYTASNGVNVSGTNVALGGALTSATTIGTSSTNTLKLTGIQSGATSDSVIMISNGVVKKIATSAIPGTTYTGSNGVGVSGTTVSLGGNLASATTIGTSSSNTLKLTGIQAGAATDSFMVISNGVIKKVSSAAAGDVSGNYNALSVDKIKGVAVSTTAPSSGQVLKYNSVTSKWEPNTDNNTTYTASNGVNVSGTNVALGGALTSATTIGTSSTNTLKLTGVQTGATSDSVMMISSGVVKKIATSSIPGTTYTGSNGVAVSGTTVSLGGNLASATTIGTSSTNTLKLTGVQAGATSDSVMVISNGIVKKVAQSSIAGTTYTAGTGMTLSGTTFNANTTSALWNANQLQGRTLSATAPTSGQTLKWNGTSWTPGNDSIATYTAGNGVSMASNKVTLGGALTGATTIGTSSTNTLKLTGIQTGATSDSVMMISSGVLKKIATSSITGTTYSAGNGLTLASGKFTIGGALSAATTIQTSSTNTLTLTGIQSGASTDSVMVISSGVLKKVAQSSITSSSSQWTTSGSNIYNANSGNVGINTSSPGSTFDAEGTFQTKVSQITSDITIASTDIYHIITVNSTSRIDITLPTPSSSMAGREYIIKAIVSSPNIYLNVPSGGTKLDGSTSSKNYTSGYSSVRVFTDGSNWYTF